MKKAQDKTLMNASDAALVVDVLGGHIDIEISEEMGRKLSICAAASGLSAPDLISYLVTAQVNHG